MNYTKKAQVLLTEEEYSILEEVSAKTHKKLSALIREAVKKIYIEERKRAEVSESIDRLLSLRPVPAPEDYSEWEKEYSRLKEPCDLK
ncbi:MAG: hypothetical protein AABZ05_06290 [Nitrospirota bacterium]